LPTIAQVVKLQTYAREHHAARAQYKSRCLPFYSLWKTTDQSHCYSNHRHHAFWLCVSFGL